MWIASEKDIETYAEELFTAFADSFSDYPEAYRPKLNKEKSIEGFKRVANSPTQDFWICRNIESGKIIGHAICGKQGEMVHLTAVKIAPQFLGTEINAALAYRICEHYINDKGYAYVCDGERNIRHQTSYQDFLIRVLGFKRVYCKLNVIYHPWIKPVVATLYPLRKIIGKIGERNSFIYNIFCLLMQEQYARGCNK